MCVVEGVIEREDELRYLSLRCLSYFFFEFSYVVVSRSGSSSSLRVEIVYMYTPWLKGVLTPNWTQ